MINNINFFDGEITFNELTFLDTNIPPENQLCGADEDLLQVLYGSRYVVDVGWYARGQGFFIIYVIKDSNWETPIFEKKTKKIPLLINYLNEAILLAHNLKVSDHEST